MTGRDIEIVILSDVHLGTYGCHAKELVKYLKSIRPQTLILNGDFIDGSQRRKNAFPKSHLKVIKAVLKKIDDGTKVYYIAGKEDRKLHPISEMSNTGIQFRDELDLHLHSNKYWMLHGDVFDGHGFGSAVLQWFHRQFYWMKLNLFHFFHFRNLLGALPHGKSDQQLPPMDGSGGGKSKFEQRAIQQAILKGYDFVVCGHSHHPCIEYVKRPEGSVTYMNAGDWVQHLTALEYHNKQWGLYHYNAMEFGYINARLNVSADRASNGSIDIGKAIELLQNPNTFSL